MSKITDISTLPQFPGWEPIGLDEPMEKHHKLVALKKFYTLEDRDPRIGNKGIDYPYHLGQSYNKAAGHSLNEDFYPYRKVVNSMDDHPDWKYFDQNLFHDGFRPLHPTDTICNGDRWVSLKESHPVGGSIGYTVSSYIHRNESSAGFFSGWPFRAISPNDPVASKVVKRRRFPPNKNFADPLPLP